ncbi:MAG: hypothetical protein SGCHY_002874 [Lobulomycetales sp.]
MMNLATLLLAAAVSVNAVPIPEASNCNCGDGYVSRTVADCNGQIMTVPEGEGQTIQNYLGSIGITGTDSYILPTGFVCPGDQVCVPARVLDEQAETKCDTAGGEVYTVTADDAENGKTLGDLYGETPVVDIEAVNAAIYGESTACTLRKGDQVCVPKEDTEDEDVEDVLECQSTYVLPAECGGQIMNVPVEEGNNNGQSIEAYLESIGITTTDSYILPSGVVCQSTDVCVPARVLDDAATNECTDAGGEVYTQADADDAKTLGELYPGSGEDSDPIAGVNAAIYGGSTDCTLWKGDQVCVPKEDTDGDENVKGAEDTEDEDVDENVEGAEDTEDEDAGGPTEDLNVPKRENLDYVLADSKKGCEGCSVTLPAIGNTMPIDDNKDVKDYAGDNSGVLPFNDNIMPTVDDTDCEDYTGQGYVAKNAAEDQDVNNQDVNNQGEDDDVYEQGIQSSAGTSSISILLAVVALMICI